MQTTQSEFDRRFPLRREGNFLVYNRGIKDEASENYPFYSKLPEGLDLVVIKLGGSVVKQRDHVDTNLTLLNLKLQIKSVRDKGYGVAVVTSGAMLYAEGGPLEEGQRRLMEKHRLGPQYFGVDEFLFDSTELEGSTYAKQFAEAVIASVSAGNVPYINASPDSFLKNRLDNSTATGHMVAAMTELGKHPLAVILGKFPGIYIKNAFKKQGPGASVIRVVLNSEGLDKHVVPEEEDASQSGFGGMGTTINAAIQLQEAGVETIVTNGMAYQRDLIVQEHRPIEAILAERYVGTRFMPKQMWQFGGSRYA